MKQAILIMAHGNIAQLNRLIKYFDSDSFDIYIHFDKKNAAMTSEITKTKKSHLEIFTDFDIRWATYDQVECELFLLEKAMAHEKYEYYHLLSGLDIPLKSRQDVYNFFHKSKKEFLHFQTDTVDDAKMGFVKYSHPFVRAKNFRKNKLLQKSEAIFSKIQSVMHVNKVKNEKRKFYTGANWFSITGDFAKYVVSEKDWIEKTFKHAKSSDEFFMQTLLMNSKFKSNLYSNKMNDDYIACVRLIDWNRGGPYTWRIDDFDEMMKSKCMFARKVDEKVDNKIIEKIYKTIC